MYRFYVPYLDESMKEISLSGEDFNHIKNVLRMRVGEQIQVCDGAGITFCCSISEINNHEVVTKAESYVETSNELPIEIILFQGMPKKDKLEFIIQKAVELGVSRIVPVVTKRTIVKFEDKKSTEKKVARWNSIALSAAKQSNRDVIPVVTEPISYLASLEEAKKLDNNIIPYEKALGIENSRNIVSNLCTKKSAGIFIGPEGGFEEAEIEKALELGIEPITLGKRILRTETAGLAILSIIMFNTDK